MRSQTTFLNIGAALACFAFASTSAQQYDYAVFDLDTAPNVIFPETLAVLSDTFGDFISTAQCEDNCDSQVRCLMYSSSAIDATTTGRCITWAYPQAGETRYGGNGGGFYVQALKYDKPDAPICIEGVDLFGDAAGNCVCNGALANPVIPREQDTPYGCRNSLIPSGLAGIRRRNRILPGLQAKASFE